MKPLRDDAQRLFELARHAHEPLPDAKSRNRSKLQARLAAGAVIGVGAAVSKTTLALGVGGALGKGPVVALLLVGAAGLGYGVGTLIDAPQVSVPERPKNAKAVTPSVERQPFKAEPSSSRLAGPAISASSARLPTKASAPATRFALGAAPDAPVDKSAAPSRAADLAAETELIRQANQAIVSGDFSRAMALLGEHERKFPKGILAEERIATELIAYCRSGRGSAVQERLQQFTNRWPKSPHWARIRNACGPLGLDRQK